MDPAPTTWQVEVTAWCTWLSRDARRSIGTVRVRRCHLEALARWAPVGPWAMTTSQLLEWMARRDWAPETRRLIRSSVRGFYAWAVATGRLDRSPALGIPSVPVPRGVPRPIPDPVAAEALRLADDRLQLLIELAAFCGLRACELAMVHSGDLIGFGETSGLLVHGRGGHERVVPLVDDELRERIRRAHGWAFPGRQDGHISAHYVSRLLSAGLPDGWTGHTLRHRAATIAWAETENLRAVQELLGHASIVTTQRYALVTSAALRRVAAAAHGLRT